MNALTGECVIDHFKHLPNPAHAGAFPSFRGFANEHNKKIRVVSVALNAIVWATANTGTGKTQKLKQDGCWISLSMGLNRFYDVTGKTVKCRFLIKLGPYTLGLCL